jgi:flagellar basal body rod protein FlgC
MDPISTARYGLMAASRQFETAAADVVGAASGGDQDMISGIVGMAQAKHAFAANATVIRFAQDMWDSLLRLQTR